MKYIKKDKYKNTKHDFRNKQGGLISISQNIIEDDYIYEQNKFVFDILEEDENIIDDLDEENLIVDEDDIETENIVEEEIEEVVIDQKEIEKNELLEELSECTTIKQIHELAEDNKLDLDGRIRNIKKLKDNFIEELNE